MSIPPKTLALAAVACILILPSCGSVPGGGTLGGITVPHDTVTISPHPASMPAGSTMTFTCTETGGTSNNCSWIVEDPGGTTPVGTPTTLSNSSTFLYTAPAAPPVYSGFIPSSQQGIVSVFADFGGGSASITFPITTTTVSVGITYPGSPPTVALSASQQFEGYAVGNVNNAIAWQVNGVAGGSVATGTILNTGASPGLYTAPAAIPMTGASITITAVSQADPTKSASMVVTLH